MTGFNGIDLVAILAAAIFTLGLALRPRRGR